MGDSVALASPLDVPFPAPVGEEWRRLKLEASGQTNRVPMEMACNELRFDDIRNQGSHCQRGSRHEVLINRLKKKVTVRGGAPYER